MLVKDFQDLESLVKDFQDLELPIKDHQDLKSPVKDLFGRDLELPDKTTGI